MKKYLLILLIILLYFLVPKYNELNHISIIKYIGIEKYDDKTIYYLKEIIPYKENNNIKYKYKIYTGNSIEEIEKNQNKKLYLNKAKFIITNKTYNSNKVLYTSNVYETIKSIN